MGGQNINENTDTLGIIKDKAHTIQHAATSTADHTFPSGTANFLRADGTFAAPPTGSGTPSGTVLAETTFSIAAGAGTSAEYSRGDHTHGSVADLVSGTAHASLTTGVHSLGTMALQASAAFATTATYAAHTTSDGVHGAGTVASVAAVTAQITTHAALTSVHSLNTASTASSASYALTTTYAAHTASATTHGVAGTIAAKADIATDANLSAAAQSSILKSPTYILITAAQTVTGSVLANITEWVFAAATASKYVFEAAITNDCASTAGIWYGVTYSGSNATIQAQLFGTRAATTAVACALTAFATKTGVKFTMVAATGAVYFTGLVATAGTAGNVQFQMCAGTAAATATIRVNSVLEVIKMA